MSQYFKGDDVEKKYEAAALEILTQIGMQIDDFFDNAYDANSLGDLLHDVKRSPLSNAIVLEIFRESFNTIYTAFTVAGSFESYLTVFRKIFGEGVDVVFNADNLTGGMSPPGPGKLTIDIIADQLEESNFIAREISNDTYVFDNVIFEDDDGTGNILFQSVKGFQSQYELEQILFEMVPDGIFTDISLTFNE